MDNERQCYYYKVVGLSDLESVEKEVEKLDGVVSCKIQDQTLVYELESWTNEYDILTASMDICEKFGGELIVGEDNTIENDKGEQVEYDYENQDNRPIDQDLKQNEQVVESVSEENQSLNKKQKDLKKDFFIRMGEILIALLLVIVSRFVSSSGSKISLSTILLTLGFAIAIYEVFYFALLDIIKKRFYTADVIISLTTISLVWFGYFRFTAIIAVIYAVIKMVIVFNERYQTLALADILDVELNDEKLAYSTANEQIKELKSDLSNKKIQNVYLVLGYVCLVVTLLSFLFLIPALNKFSNFGILALYVSVALITLVYGGLSADKNSKCGALIKCKYHDIQVDDISSLKKCGTSNSVEIDLSCMLDGENLKEDTIGALKELKMLGIQNIKTNFDASASAEVMDKVDFVEKQLKKKTTLTVGLNGKDVNFEGDNSVRLKGKEMFRLPLLVRVAKRFVKMQKLQFVLKVVSAISLCLTVILYPPLKNMLMLFWLSAVPIICSAVCNLLSLVNNKK